MNKAEALRSLEIKIRSMPANVIELEYHRPPTKGEIRFGYGATHYRTFPIETCCQTGTRIPKKWFKAEDDGLRYYRH